MLSRFQIILSIFVTLGSSLAFAQSESAMGQMQVSAGARWCAGDNCIVPFYFYGFENIPRAAMAETQSLPTCGSEDEANALANSQFGSPSGKSGLAIAIRTQDSPIMRLCNPQRFPNYISSSMPQLNVVFKRNTNFDKVDIRFRDRANKSGTRYKVRVPSEIPASQFQCEKRFVKVSDTQLTLRNVDVQEHTLMTTCFDMPAKRSSYFEIHTVNKANTQCSDLIMKAVSPSGKEYVSFGSQPGAAPAMEPGPWKMQLYLNAGCRVYDFNVLSY